VVILVLAGLTQLICVWLTARRSGGSAFLACTLCEFLCVSEGLLDVGWSRIVQVGMTRGNSVLLHMSHPPAGCVGLLLAKAEEQE